MPDDEHACGEGDDGPGRPGFVCDGGRHSSCPHVPFATAVRLLPLGVRVGGAVGGPGVVLCRCACHAECALAGRGDGAGWPEGCSCNETLRRQDLVARLPEAGEYSFDLLGGLREGVGRTRRLRAARRAAAVAGAGRPASEVAAIVDEEWSRRGLDRPGGPWRASTVSAAVDPPGYYERVVVTARVVRDLVSAPLRFRELIGRQSGAARRSAAGGDVFELATGEEVIEVQVTPSVSAVLAGIPDEGFLAPSVVRLVSVEVRQEAGDGLGAWHQPAAGGAPQRLCSIPPGEAARFRPGVRAAGRVGQRCTCPALSFRDRDGGWKLAIRRPLSGRPAGSA